MKRLQKMAGVIGAAIYITGSSLPVCACDLSAEELFEKYSFTYQIMWSDSTNAFRAVLTDYADEEFILYDSEGNIIDAPSASYAAYSDNTYRRISAEDPAHPIYNCDYENGFYYSILEDGTATVAGVNYDYFNEESPFEITIPEKLGNTTVVRIEPFAFSLGYSFLPQLNSIHIPDTVEQICNSSFYCAFAPDSENCYINIPAQVKYIGCNAYGGIADALGDVIRLPESTEFVNNYAFGKNHQPIEMPKSLVFTGYTLINGSHRVITAQPFVTDPVTAVRFGENCITADETVFSNKSVEAMLNEAEERREQFAAQATEQSIHYIGDLDENGEVNVMDSVMLARLVGDDPELEISDTGKANADFNADGAVDPNDLSDLLKYLAKF